MEPINQEPKIQSVHAILVLDGGYILQLRDNKSSIAAPGKWSLFGGMKKERETPYRGIRREIYEELLIDTEEYKYLWFTDYYASFEKTIIRTWFFASDVTSLWSKHQLKEGRAVKCFRFEQLVSLDIVSVMRETIERYHQQCRKDIDGI